MEGTVKKIVEGKNFGFIKCRNKEYFFHQSDFNGHWNDLVADYQSGMPIRVECEEVESNRGLRVGKVKRMDWPNQAEV